MMLLSHNELLLFGNCTEASRNFIEGKRLFDTKHILKCGRVDDANKYTLLAFCLRGVGMKKKPREIRGRISELGKCLNMTCTCPAGQSEKCKHIMCLLFYLKENDIEKIELFSCTDVECYWKMPYQELLKSYEPCPLEQHQCFIDLLAKTKNIEISDEVQVKIKEKLFANKQSALGKHIVGRHALVSLEEPTINIQPHELTGILCIIYNDKSLYLEKLSEVIVKPLGPCCQLFLKRLNKDPLEICVMSKVCNKNWKAERQFRITGSRCYIILTYTSNKAPDWNNKALKYFYPKNVVTAAMRYGTVTEPKALKAYESYYQVEVVKCGLIVSQSNPWLGYSPDGVIIRNNKPLKLLEIKCPVEGKKVTAKELLPKLNCLKKSEESFQLKEKHAYYGQVQLGMVMLNVKSTDFVIYSSFDDTFEIITVNLDHDFVIKLLVNLKRAYLENMIHSVCLQENLCNPNSDE